MLNICILILCRAAYKPDYMSQSGRPFLSNGYNQNAYFSGNGIRTCFSFRGNKYASSSCIGKQKIEGLNEVFSLQSAKDYLKRVVSPCGGVVEYLHRSPASRRRRRKKGSLESETVEYGHESHGTQTRE
jgi:hypothetical protein